MPFSESIKTCLSKYVTFSGRAARSEYWWFVLFFVVVSVVLGMIDRAIFGVDPVTNETNKLLGGLFGLAMFLPILAAGWRRMHDAGKPGWYLLLPMLVSFATFAFLMMGVVAFSGLENAGVNSDALRGPAAVLGLTGMVAVGVVQTVLAVLLIWWLTRPSDPSSNEYGPPPVS